MHPEKAQCEHLHKSLLWSLVCDNGLCDDYLLTVGAEFSMTLPNQCLEHVGSNTSLFF